MKIERINENQIRCTLSNFDLSVRNVNLSELAYGSEKARNLFREMIQRASSEVGFEAEDIPLMVEAIPMANDSVMLIITKIEDPEELDTRFSKFSAADEEEDPALGNLATELLDGADAFLNLLGNQGSGQEKSPKAAPSSSDKNSPSQKNVQAEEEATDPARYIRIYQFSSLDQVCGAARETGSIFSGSSVLYKNPQSGKYYLVLKKESSDELSFSRTCNILSEYGTRLRQDPAAEAYYAEHYEVIVKQNTLAALAAI